MNDILDLEAQVKAAQQAYQQTNYLTAAREFGAVAEAYRARGQELKAAEMANNQSVALLQAGDAEGALQAVEGTEEIFEKGGDRLKAAMAIGNRAAALDTLNRLEEAEAGYRRSAELLDELDECEMRAHVLQAISALQMRAGRQLEALANMKAGMGDIRKPTMRQRMLKKLLDFPNKILPGR